MCCWACLLKVHISFYTGPRETDEGTEEKSNTTVGQKKIGGKKKNGRRWHLEASECWSRNLNLWQVLNQIRGKVKRLRSDKHIPSHSPLSGVWTSSKHSKAPWLAWRWRKKYSTGHLSISFEGPVEHIKNKAQCQKHTSEKFICVSVQWPLERSLMEMSSDPIYFSASWPWKTFHLVTNAKKGSGMNCTRRF